MKKSTIITTLLLVAGTTSMAQRKAGSKMIGTAIGSTTYTTGTSAYEYPTPSSNSTYDSKTFSISLYPNIGWFLNENVVVGGRLEVGFSSGSYKSWYGGGSPSTTKSHGTNFGIGPWARFYLGDAKSSVWPYVQVSGGIGTGISRSTSNQRHDTGNPITSYNYESKGSYPGSFNWNAGADLGITKMLNPHVGLDLSVSFTHYYNKSGNKSDATYKYDGGAVSTSTYEYDYKNTSNPVGIKAGVVIIL
jgi:hypothetical protein